MEFITNPVAMSDARPYGVPILDGDLTSINLDQLSTVFGNIIISIANESNVNEFATEFLLNVSKSRFWLISCFRFNV